MTSEDWADEEETCGVAIAERIARAHGTTLAALQGTGDDAGWVVVEVKDGMVSRRQLLEALGY
jgi:hypothetical protein